MKNLKVSRKAKCHHWTATAIKASDCFTEKGKVDLEIWERLFGISKGNCHRLVGSSVRAATCEDVEWGKFFLKKAYEAAITADHWMAVARCTKEECSMHSLSVERFCQEMFSGRSVYALPLTLNSLNPVLEEIRER